jgi:hypothetical protein
LAAVNVRFRKNDSGSIGEAARDSTAMKAIATVRFCRPKEGYETIVVTQRVQREREQKF